MGMVQVAMETVVEETWAVARAVARVAAATAVERVELEMTRCINVQRYQAIRVLYALPQRTHSGHACCFLPTKRASEPSGCQPTPERTNNSRVVVHRPAVWWAVRGQFPNLVALRVGSVRYFKSGD